MVPRLAERASAAESPSPQAPAGLPHLLRLAVSPPPLDEGMLHRPHALRALERASGAKLTLLTAPAGYGKTTLLSSWAGAFPTGGAARRRIAWLTVRPEQNEPALFRAMLAAAFFQAGVPMAWPPVLPAELQQQPCAELAYALNAVAEFGEPVVLILDGYEALSSLAAHELISFLIDHAPPTLRLVVAARGEPALPLARLRVQRQLAELRADRLRWSQAEAGAYLNGMLGLGLGPDQLVELYQQSEGWVTGLHLAALAMGERSNAVGARPASFGGEHRFVAGYLLDEVVARQPQLLRDFLLHSAALDELSGPLVEAVLFGAGLAQEDGPALLGGFPSGQAALEAVERHDLFLAPLTGRPGWYRYHGLFAAALRAQLARQAPGRTEILRARAAAWLARPSAARPARVLPGARPGFTPTEALSEREYEVLGLIAAGQPNGEIAARLNISLSTVKTHLKHIFAKLNARNRTEAVAIARDIALL